MSYDLDGDVSKLIFLLSKPLQFNSTKNVKYYQNLHKVNAFQVVLDWVVLEVQKNMDT